MPRYQFSVHEDGTGIYTATVTRPGAPDEQITSPLAISSKTAASLFQAARTLRGFRVDCASHAKVADTGSKTLTYIGADGGTGSCTYNYSERSAVQAVTTTFMAMETALEDSRKLASDHRYDRLGLGEDMAALYKAVQDGSATEMGNIAGVLREIAGDPEVLDQVRQRASALLETAGR